MNSVRAGYEAGEVKAPNPKSVVMEPDAAPQQVVAKRVWRTVLPLVTLDDSDDDQEGGDFAYYGYGPNCAANRHHNHCTSGAVIPQPQRSSRRRVVPASARTTRAVAASASSSIVTSARSADHTPVESSEALDIRSNRPLQPGGSAAVSRRVTAAPSAIKPSNARGRGGVVGAGQPLDSPSVSPLTRNVAEVAVWDKAPTWAGANDAVTRLPAATVAPFVVVCSPGCGQLFECMRDFLESERGGSWKDGGDALLAFITGGSTLPAVRAAAQQQQQRISSAAPRRPASASAVCCDRLAVVNLFLSDKTTAERLCEESRLFQAKELRAEARNATQGYPPTSNQSSSSSGGGGGGCAHQREVERSVASNRFPCVSKYPLTLCSYIEGFRCITLKSKMVKTLLAYHGGSWRLLGAYLPLTFQVTPRGGGGGRPRDEREVLVETMCECNVAEFQRTGEIATYWIAKSSHGAHGANIRIFFADQRGLDMLVQFIDGQPDPYPWVVSRYVDRPLLYRGRKFDVRCWVLVSPNLSVYLHRDLVMRTSSELYNRENLTTDNARGRLANITNHCVQVEGDGYSLHEEGNELWRDTLDELIRSTYRSMSREAQQRNAVFKKYLGFSRERTTNHYSRNAPYVSKSAPADRVGDHGGSPAGHHREDSPSNCATLAQCILPQIREIVVNCTLAAQAQIPRSCSGGGDNYVSGGGQAAPPQSSRPHNRHVTQSFQLMGYDFIIDENFVVWLLEVNGSPGVAQKLLPGIVRDTVEILIDPLFPARCCDDDGGDKAKQSTANSNHRRNGFELIHRGK